MHTAGEAGPPALTKPRPPDCSRLGSLIWGTPLSSRRLCCRPLDCLAQPQRVPCTYADVIECWALSAMALVASLSLLGRRGLSAEEGRRRKGCTPAPWVEVEPWGKPGHRLGAVACVAARQAAQDLFTYSSTITLNLEYYPTPANPKAAFFSL